MRLSFFLLLLAERTGLEPAASGVTGRRYNQLNYRSSLKDYSIRPAKILAPFKELALRLPFVGGELLP